ncbi:radical SAM/SPASM domain-containing protein [Kitasatospora sp. NPDC092286]|uniref:radical SAM/SPASM domain-containing protein n=1 Tax=Kitasatospora sp. NPDC092286 TaxID=3364087 RepID=UPI0038122AE7
MDHNGATPNGLDFLWLELTNRCNLQCVHCYADSHPNSGYRDLLSTEHYERVIEEAYRLGCRKIQFIGGEPQLNSDFDHLLRLAKKTGYDFIEVFSNLTRLTDETLDYAAENDILFATSVYSCDPAVHDAVTKVRTSHTRTIGNLKKLIGHGVGARASVIAIDQDEDDLNRTTRFLEGLGVRYVKVGRIREFGRAQEVMSRESRLSGLCGHCWKGKLCVTPDGTVYPCVMARQWPVGNVLHDTLSQIVNGEPLGRMRQSVYEQVWLGPSQCSPNCPQSCEPENCPEAPCEPEICPMSCEPNEPCVPEVARPPEVR